MAENAAGAAKYKQEDQALIRVERVSKTFRRRNFWREKQIKVALCEVELQIPRGSTLAIVGESGSGKSTLAMCLAQLETVDSGAIWYRDQNLTTLRRADLVPIRRRIQLIFQDAASALNPRFTAIEIASEPLDIAGSGTKQQRRDAAVECMRLAGLPSEMATRFPFQLSGGQRQRLAIARALTLSPELLIFDESFSGLDLVLEEQVLALLNEVRASQEITYLIITHDLSLVAGIADYIAVMQSGRIVEQSPARQVLSEALHEHTQELLAAVPKWDLAAAARSGA